MRIEIEEVLTIEIEELANAWKDIIVVQDVGIPGSQGEPGDLSTTTFVPPITYDIPTKTLEIEPGSEIGQVLEWNGTAWAPSAPLRVKHHIVTAAEEAAKQIVLDHPVTKPDEFLFDIADGGGSQFPSADFQLVASDIVSWDGLSLDGVLAEGDRVRFVYH